MKTLVAIGMIFFSFNAFAGPILKGKCAKKAAKAIDASYGEAVLEGNYAAVVSSKKVSESIYKVVVVAMDGSSEPFGVSYDVAVDSRTCEVKDVKYSR